MPQLTVTATPNQAFAGLLEAATTFETDSLAAEGAVGLGKLVRLGTNKDKQCVQLSSATGQGALAYGFAPHNFNREQTTAGLVQYDDKETVPVVRKGRIWVETQDAVVKGATANYHLASQKLTDEAVTTGIEAIGGNLKVTFLTSTSAAGLALVEVK